MLVNLTTHPFHLVRVAAGKDKRFHGKLFASKDDVQLVRTIEPSGKLARTCQDGDLIGTLFGCPIRHIRPKPLEGLPEPDGGTVYVVAARVIEAAADSGRTTEDLISPFMVVRDVDHPSTILGNLSFQRLVPSGTVEQGKRPHGKQRPKRALPDRPICNLTAFQVKMLEVTPGMLETDGSELFYAPPSAVKVATVLEPSGHTARRAHTLGKAIEHEGLMVHPMSYGAVNQLPPPDGQTLYIVTSDVLKRAAQDGRPTDDLLAPGGTLRRRDDESVSQGNLFLDSLSGNTGLLAKLLSS
jgi:hypothetical protein